MKIEYLERKREIDPDNPDKYQELPKEKRDAVCNWIDENFIRIKTPNPLRNSYHLKHLFHRSGGFYLTTEEFDGALLACGFNPKGVCVSENSFKRFRIREVKENAKR